MEKKSNWQLFQNLLAKNNIKKLYHFTDRENLNSIIQHGGLYSWADCDQRGISIPRPGGSEQSRSLDRRDNLQHFVRVSFTTQHPMMYVAMNDGRISNPVILEIDPEVIYWQGCQYADRNATKNGAHVGKELDDFQRIHFNTIKAKKHFDLTPEEQPFFQAEVLVPNFIPLKYITNVGNFGIPIPSKPQQLQSKEAYTAQITRSTPTAFIFLVDQSVSMRKKTVLHGEEMTLAEAVSRIVNNQINELVLRCIKTNEVRHYYDIAIIGYGSRVYSGWNGNLEGRFFVSPQEIKDNPYRKIITREEVRTRKGLSIKEVEKTQWLQARCDGSRTNMYAAFQKAKSLLEEWIEDKHDKDCYPPTIINITDGAFNDATADAMQQMANELKSMFTNDGNVLLFNIHISSNSANSVTFPISKQELVGDSIEADLFDMSSLLPARYNADISKVRKEDNDKVRHVAMAQNADMSTLIQLMDIGTPTNISQNK